MTFVDFLLRRYGGFAPLERFSFAALAELFAAAVRADMPARAVPENNVRDMTAEEIVREALKIASSICVYTNDHISVEKL